MKTFNRQDCAVIIFVVWLLLAAVSLWWFQLRHIGGFDEYWASFNGQTLSELPFKPDYGDALVVHFVDPSCPCSRFTTAHIESLQADLKTDIDFVYIAPETSTSTRPKLQLELQDIGLPASPAVAIWDKSGELAYFGPYSSGAFCGEGTDFVRTTLHSLTQNHNPQWINQEAVGCFCRWPTTLRS